MKPERQRKRVESFVYNKEFISEKCIGEALIRIRNVSLMVVCFYNKNPPALLPVIGVAAGGYLL